MGKRKYDNTESEPSKKVKNDDIENTDEMVSEQPLNHETLQSKKALQRHSFDMKHFRKELASKQGQTMVLTQFLNVCLNPDNEVDYIHEYLKIGGNSHEILRQITQDNKKNLTLATPAFHLFHLIIVKVQSSLPHMITITEEACRYFLNTFIPTVEIMISENSGPRHRKIILNLLTSMVTLNSDLGVEILNQLPLTPKHLQYILEKPNYKEKDNVRTAFVHFMTSFLIEGHLPLIKALLEKQGLLGLVIPGLVHDEAEAVLIFLNILKKNIIDNTLISKTLKLKTFNQQVLYNMFKVFSWKGPPEMNGELKNKLRPEITILLSDIMVTLFTSHRLGLYFIDNSLGTTDVNKNPNLYKALLGLKRPWENEYECEVILQIIHKCPDLHRAIISVVDQSFQPQHSPIWERTVEFLMKLIEKLKPEDIVSKMHKLTPLQTANFVRFITLPVPLLKHIQPNIGQDQTISLYCAKVLVKMLQMLKRYIQILESIDNQTLVVELRSKLEYFVPKHLPPPTAIVSLIKNVMSDSNSADTTQDYRLPKPDEAESLLVLIDLLLLYNSIHPAFFESLEGNIDIKSILDHSKTISNTCLLKFKIVSLWLMLDSSTVSTKNPMFKDLFRIMLDVYTNDSDNTWIEAKDTLHVFFKNTNIFEDDEDEIHLILYALRKVKVNPISLIGDIVEYAITNKKELTALVRNQINSLEIETKDENLEALFNGLMKNKCNDDNVFMENKVPSPFVVACIQYTMPNKDAKKSLKQFLSLYIANLLHCNYSPELTEILMGDSKVDVRNYVASWMGEPIALQDGVVGKDNVLCNLSRSLIANEDLALEEIFTFLEKSTEEEKDIEISGSSLKIAQAVDSSELLIWARYLVFCVVKLTQMNRFTEVEEDKIKIYIDCLIEICKKQHMIQVSRNIILNMFKNSHVLKIYTPTEQKKNESNVLVTKLLLHVLTQHSEIVNYLDRKKNILLPYQIKNCKEIMNILKKIKKKKYTKSEQTVKVLEEVGLRRKDDMIILNHIFNADLNTCVSEDKEPSLLLVILCVIITKYSKSIKLDLPQDALLKSLKMYCQLLKSLEINVNLTDLEIALASYFDNKPQSVTCVSEDIFRSFFQTNTVRKSTSQLAYTLLKFDEKLCKIFKEEIDRPQILSQRELTLPLGNAVLNHNTFLLNNKEFLTKIYDEYKSNINKYLEKPHKAGQIYLTTWKFIKKLIIECMDVQDCKKLLTKTHKFEVVDIGHINLFQSVFLKICLEENNKKDYLIHYYLSMLHLLTTAIKENVEMNIVNEIVHNIIQVTQVSKHITGFNIEEKQDFAKITENNVWQNFCKAVLKASLRIKTANESIESGSKLLCLLTRLIKLFYSKDHEDIITLFDMVTSHSEFLNVMLSHHSLEIKSRLLEILFALISINKSVMKPQQIPVYLSAYGATTGSCDKIILSILHCYESNQQPVNEYKPYVWGDSAANYYAVRKNRTSSLWGHPTPNQVLNLFDKEIIERTVRNFPVNQKLEYNYELPEFNDVGVSNKKHSFKSVLNEVFNESNIKPVNDNESAIKCLIEKSRFELIMMKLKQNDITECSHVDPDAEIYDPVFVFSLLSHLLAPGSVASCFKLLRIGLLSVPVMALSSNCPMMRSAAYHVLHRFCMLLETETKHKNDKLFLGDFITTLRMSLSTAITDSANNGQDKNPRLPSIGALYLAKALMVSTAPFDPLYKPVNNFFIAKEIVDLTNVPDFLSLFHDSDVESIDRRQWILDIIKDGTKTMTDVNVVFKSMCLKMMMDFYSTELCDRKTREKIISALNSIITVPKAFDILIKGYGFLSWLHYAVRQIRKDEKCVVIQMFDLFKSMLYSLRIDSLTKVSLVNNVNGKIDTINVRVDKEIEFKILLILIDLSNYLEGLELADIYEYVGIYKIVSKKTVKLLTKKQILNLINKCVSLVNVDETVHLLSKAVANGARILKSKNVLNLEETSMDTCIFKELTILVQTYLT